MVEEPEETRFLQETGFLEYLDGILEPRSNNDVPRHLFPARC
jgi:hypothetical protein